MGLFTQSEIMLMIGVVSVLLICITILTILDIREYLKSKKENINSKIIFEEEYPPVEEEAKPVEVLETNNDEILLQDIKNDFEEEDIFLEELDDIKIPLSKVEEPQTNIFMEEVPMLEDIEVEKKEDNKTVLYEELEKTTEKVPNEKNDITSFEMEQERTAIISLDELLNRSDELYNDNELVQYDDGDEPITIDEVIERFNKTITEPVKDIVEESREVPKVIEDTFEEKEVLRVEPYSKKESIPFISSVYGIEKDNHALEFENTATYEKLNRSNNDFMAKLREMNENK